MNMNDRKRVRRMVDVMEAWLDGEKIEYRCKLDGPEEDWLEVVSPAWDWDEFDYRVASEPLELWIGLAPDSVLRYGVYESLADATKAAECPFGAITRIVHVKEVEE